MGKVFRVFLGVCALVSLSALAEAQSRQKCRDISGSGVFAKFKLDSNIEALEKKAPGKVKAKGAATCTDLFKCKQKVCAPSAAWSDYCLDCPECCDDDY